MNDPFEKKVRAAAVAGWWVVLIAAGFLTLIWLIYLAVMSTHPTWLLRTCNLLTSLFRRNGTVIPCGELVIEDNLHGLFVVFRSFLAGRVFAAEQMNGGC